MSASRCHHSPKIRSVWNVWPALFASRFLDSLFSLLQRIRSYGHAVAKMDIRRSRATITNTVSRTISTPGLSERRLTVRPSVFLLANNDASRHLADKLNQRLTSHRSADNHRTFVINSDNATAVLSYVDAKYRNRHDLAPLPSMTRHHTRFSRKGGPSHNQHIFIQYGQ